MAAQKRGEAVQQGAGAGLAAALNRFRVLGATLPPQVLVTATYRFRRLLLLLP